MDRTTFTTQADPKVNLLFHLHPQCEATKAKRPVPPTGVEHCTKLHLQEGFLYARQSLRDRQQPVSPSASHCLKIYKATLNTLLAEEYADAEEQKDFLNNVLRYEKDMDTIFDPQHPISNEQLEISNCLIALRRYELATRYSHYFEHVCQNLNPSLQKKAEEFFSVSAEWKFRIIQLHHRIMAERDLLPIIQRRDPSVTERDIPATLGVRRACDYLGINPHRSYSTIAAFAGKTDMIHESIETHIERGWWFHLKQVLTEDLRDLPMVTPPHLTYIIPFLQETIKTVRDQCFDLNGYPEETAFWTPQRKLYDTVKVAKEQNPDFFLVSERVLSPVVQDIKRSATDRCQRLLDNYSARHENAAKSCVTPSELRKEMRNMQRKTWDTMVEMHIMANRYHEKEYFYSYSEMGPKIWLFLVEEEEAEEEMGGENFLLRTT